MKDLKLDENGDLAIENGQLVFVEGLDYVAQKITMELRAWLGEYVYDRSVGMPYLQVIFQRGTRPEAVQFIVEERIRSVPGVLDVLELNVDINPVTRKATITGRVRATKGETPFIVPVTA